jgi:fatty acid desaturase
VACLAGLYLLFNGYVISGCVVLGIVEGRCGWLMHEGGHLSLTGRIGVDHLLQVVTYGLGCGMSAAWWRNQHNKHHAMPQKLEHDVDLNTLPLVLFHSEVRTHLLPCFVSLVCRLTSALCCDNNRPPHTKRRFRRARRGSGARRCCSRPSSAHSSPRSGKLTCTPGTHCAPRNGAISSA